LTARTPRAPTRRAPTLTARTPRAPTRRAPTLTARTPRAPTRRAPTLTARTPRAPTRRAPTPTATTRGTRRSTSSTTPAPAGTAPAATDPRGPDPPGTDPEGTAPQGTAPDGTDPEGTDPEGTDPDGDDQGQLSIDIEYDTRYRGQVQIGYGSGYAPGTVVQGFMNSTPTIDLGTQVADANGEVTFRWTIPASAAIDTHTLSPEADGYATQSVSFRVLADVSAGGSGGSGRGGGSGSGRLPSTGADTTFLGAAALLLLAGGAVALGSARIRRRSSSEV